jgi:hypothetical protein
MPLLYYCSAGNGDWAFHNGTFVSHLSTYQVTQYSENRGRRKALHFTPFTSDLQGYYYCFESFNMSRKVAHLGIFVTFNLAPVNMTFAPDVNIGTILLTWAVETGLGALDYYDVVAGPLTYRLSKSSPVLVVDPYALVGPGTSSKVKFTVTATYNGFPFSRTKYHLIVNGPANVFVSNKTLSSMTVDWSTDYVNIANDDVTVVGFSIQYKKSGEEQYMSAGSLVQPPIDITGLSPGTKYIIRVWPVLANNATMTTSGPFSSQALEISTLALSTSTGFQLNI